MKYIIQLLALFFASYTSAIAAPATSLFQCEQFAPNSQASAQCLLRQETCQHAIDNMSLEGGQLFQPPTYWVNKNKRVYFYAYPSEECRYNNQFVISGDRLTLVGYRIEHPKNRENSFILVSYKDTTGWIKENEIEPIDFDEDCDATNEAGVKSLPSQPYHFEKTYFVTDKKLPIYTAPAPYCRDTARYLIQNDRVRVLYAEPYNGFYFISYTHPITGNHLYGWLAQSGLQPQKIKSSENTLPAVSPDLVVLDFYDSQLKSLDFHYSTPDDDEYYFVTKTLRNKINTSLRCNYDTPEPLSSEEQAVCDQERECDNRGCNWDGTWILSDANYYIKSQDDLDSWVENRKAKIRSINNKNAVVELILGEGKPQPLHVMVTLINQHGQWKINNIDEVE